MEDLLWEDAEKERPYSNKSGVYSLGMSLLELATMYPVRETYHYDDYQIDHVDVKNRVNIVGKNYGGYMEKLLSDMLTVDTTLRPSFPELESRLPKLFKNEQ